MAERMDALTVEGIELHFDNPEDFKECMHSVTEMTTMTNATIGDMKFTTECDDEEKTSSTGMFAELNGETYRISSPSEPSIVRRLGCGGEKYSKLPPGKKKTVLRIYQSEFSEVEVKVCALGDLLIGVHSAHYSPIPQEEIIQAFTDNLMLSYDGFTFESATYKHDITEAVYKVEDEETAKRYCKALIDAGKAISLSDIEFRIAVRTADAATCSVTVQPYVMTDGKENYPLSSPMRVEHRDGMTMQDVTDKFLQIYSYNANAVENLEKMLTIELSYPSAVIYRLVKEYKLPIKPMRAIADRFAVEQFGYTMTAHDLYANACLAMRDEKFLNMTDKRQMEAMDAFSKILKITEDGWKKLDKPGKTLLD